MILVFETKTEKTVKVSEHNAITSVRFLHDCVSFLLTCIPVENFHRLDICISSFTLRVVVQISEFAYKVRAKSIFIFADKYVKKIFDNKTVSSPNKEIYGTAYKHPGK